MEEKRQDALEMEKEENEKRNESPQTEEMMDLYDGSMV